MKNYGNIIVHRTVNINNLPETLTYEWTGGPWTSMDIKDIHHLQPGGIFQVGPYKLKIVGENLSRFAYDCIRVDYPFWKLAVFAHQASKLLRIICARTIITLAVWGLADFNCAMIPSWRDIHACQWVANRIRRGS